MKRAPSFGYTAAGHVTADVLPSGERRPGGGAFYSALQAARLGERALIITGGVSNEIEQLLSPYLDELELEIQPAEQTTTLLTSFPAGERRQRLLAWAGPLRELGALDTAILHLAPVARERTTDWSGRADFVGLTPQGLVRRWAAAGEPFEAARLEAQMLPSRCDAIVLSEAERACCTALLGEQQGAAGPLAQAVVAITAAGSGASVRSPRGPLERVPVAAQVAPVDELGAGDVFAAAFFIALRDGATPRTAAELGSAAAAVRIAGAGPDAIGDAAALRAMLCAGGRSARRGRGVEQP